MTKKQIVRCVAFMLSALMLIILMCDLFEIENTKNFDQNMYTYRNMPEDTVDGIFFGTSGVDRYWIAPKAYEENGLAIYSLAYDAFPAWLYTNILDETLDKQNPELILFDIRAFYQSNTRLTRVDVRARRYLDSLPFFSINRIKAAFETMKVIHEQDPSKPRFDASYLFSFIKYHSKWSDDYSLSENLGSKEQKYGSYYLTDDRVIGCKPHDKVVYDANNYFPLDKVTEKALYDLIDYIKEHKLQVLFVDTPQFLGKYEVGRANTTYKILKENGMDYVHYYVDKSGDFAIDLDNTTEFYDESHVNYYGAEKFTAALAKYIDEKYDMPDARERKNSSKFWDGKYDIIKERISEFEVALAEKEIAKQEKALLES
ncbi:MAG: hypothetical protein E7537_05575 [Ruminococcaceae bacterium]|nr:hypothetical protein [Oscillospiraceae bacterium]